ncbi:MAG: hypothetical protein ABL894_09500, partial [Hyphomicrobium sp.]
NRKHQQDVDAARAREAEAKKKLKERQEADQKEQQAKRWQEDKARTKYRPDDPDLKAQKYYTKEGEALRNKRTGQFEPQGGVQYKKFSKPSPQVANPN